MAQTTFEVDGPTGKALDDLKSMLGIKTRAAVIRRALALASLCAREMREDGTIIFQRPSGARLAVLLRD